MTDANPYQSPSDLPSTDAGAQRRLESTLGIAFKSDWSPTGLRRRRKSQWQSIGDLTFALLTVAWLVSFVAAAGSPYSGLFCLLTPIWIIVSVLWFSSMSYRNGESFRRKFPGLAGPVAGRIEADSIRIEGNALTILARRRDCIHCMVRADRAMIQPPGVDAVLPIVDSDIVDSWQSEVTAPLGRSPGDLLGSYQTDEICVSGELRGKDLRGQTCWRIWLSVGLTCMTIGLGAIAWGAHSLATLPHWILNPPSHYQRSDADLNAITGPGVVILIFTAVFIFGLSYLSRTWRRLGRFSVLISPGMIAIENKRVAMGYHHDALNHFQWTEKGMLVRDAARRVQFLIPARWFDPDARRRIASWYQRPMTTPPSNLYVGPKV